MTSEMPALSLALACVIGCAAADPGPALRPPPVVAPAAPLGPRWVRANRGAPNGPAVPGGTLVLLGGRRAVVAPDGTVHVETTAAPEALARWSPSPPSAAPSSWDSGPRRAYRFDDPLGTSVPIFEVWEQVYVARVRDGAIDVAQPTGDVKSFNPLTGAVVGGCWGHALKKCPPRPPDAPLRRRRPPCLRGLRPSCAE